MPPTYVFKKGDKKPKVGNNIRANEGMINNRSSRSQLFFKISVPKTLSKFTGKHLCRSLFSDKVSDWRPATLLKRVSVTGCFPVNFAKVLTSPFLQNTSGSLLFKQRE